MREQLWNRRLVSTHHFRRFVELNELHRLTRSWLGPSPETTSLPFPELAGLLERLGLDDDASRLSLEALMDDTSPDTLLDRLEHLVRIVQARLVDRSGTEESRRIASLECGLHAGQRTWGNADSGVRSDLRGILSSMHSAALFGEKSFLVIRSTAEIIDAELLSCPHQDHRREVRSAADALCKAHLAWLEGFISALQPKLQVEAFFQSRSETATRCRLRCRLN